MEERENDSGELPCSGLTRRWLSCYYACCQAENEETHATVLARVIPAIEAAAATSSDVSLPSPSPPLQPVRCVVALDLSGMCLTMSEWAAALRSCCHVLPLQRLVLRDANVGDAGLRTLCRTVAASSAGARGENGAMSLTSMRSAATPSALEQLDMSGTGLTDAGPLALLVAACPRLDSLLLSGNHIGASPSGLALLCAALQTHPRVSAVDLSCNTISGTRGGAVMQGLSELIVARSISAASSEGMMGSADLATPLRTLDLSYNILGSYYLATGGRCNEGDLRAEICGSNNENNNISNKGALGNLDEARVDASLFGVGCSSRSRCGSGGCGHDAITVFPLVTALYLNNSLWLLDLRHNGLPVSLLEYVEAKLHVNRRTLQALGTSKRVSTQSQVLSVKRVEEVVRSRLQRTLQHVVERAPTQGTPILSALTSSHSVEGGDAAAENAVTPTPLDDTTPLWSTKEVKELLIGLVQSISAELTLS